MSDYVHTNRELELMLTEKKPLAMFSAFEFELPNEEYIPEKLFSDYVESGAFLRSEFSINKGYIEKIGKEGILKYVMFCDPGEQWRMPAMRLLKEQHARTRQWNETCERMEGILYGYTEDEIDAHCAKQLEGGKFVLRNPNS